MHSISLCIHAIVFQDNSKFPRVLHIYVVVQFYPWFKFYFPLFCGMVMYDNEFKTNKIQTKEKIEPQHIYYSSVMNTYYVNKRGFSFFFYLSLALIPPLFPWTLSPMLPQFPLSFTSLAVNEI